MLTRRKKFNKEITALKSIAQETELHPLRKAQLREQILGRISYGQTPALSPGLPTPKARLWKYFISLVLGFSLLTGTAFAASVNATPGDVLFPVKKAREQIQLSLARTEEAKAELETKFAEERVKELKVLKATAKLPNPPVATLSAEIKAEAETNRALDRLYEVQEKLIAKDKLNAATKINSTLLQLEAETETQLGKKRAAKREQRKQGVQEIEKKQRTDNVTIQETGTVTSATVDTGTVTPEKKEKQKDLLKKRSPLKNFLKRHD